jgi:hypothetical protein
MAYPFPGFQCSGEVWLWHLGAVPIGAEKVPCPARRTLIQGKSEAAPYGTFLEKTFRFMA